jgi:hypothetical protein
MLTKHLTSASTPVPFCVLSGFFTQSANAPKLVYLSPESLATNSTDFPCFNVFDRNAFDGDAPCIKN